ncbi:MAG: DUF58 domain-containing protein [Polyangiaceae bacterium]|nr:DUF58 domain-containing protein [Polyangiaceae bacterium]
MGLFELFQRGEKATKKRATASTSALFDDEFQKKLEMLSVVSRRVFAGRLRAERRSKKKGSGIEFADHREYSVGDDFRSVDWNAYRRFGRLLVRLYEEEEDLSIYFLVDCSSSMGFRDQRKFDQARRLCAALAYVGLANLDRVTIVGVSDQIKSTLPATRGKGRIRQIFRFLSELRPEGVTDLEACLTKFVAQHKRRGLAVLISDLYDPAGFERGINVLRFNKFEPYVLHLVDPRDTGSDLQGDVRIYDCETGEERDVTITAALLQKVNQAVAHYQEAIERFCASRQVPYFAANIEVPFEEQVLRVFRRGGFLR